MVPVQVSLASGHRADTLGIAHCAPGCAVNSKWKAVSLPAYEAKPVTITFPPPDSPVRLWMVARSPRKENHAVGVGDSVGKRRHVQVGILQLRAAGDRRLCQAAREPWRRQISFPEETKSALKFSRTSRLRLPVTRRSSGFLSFRETVPVRLTVGVLGNQMRALDADNQILHGQADRTLVAKGDGLPVAARDVAGERSDLQLRDVESRSPRFGLECRAGDRRLSLHRAGNLER